jgi:hypothetical protein
VKDSIYGLALKILQEPRHLGKDVSIGHDERHPEAARGEIGSQANDRRVRESHHDVGVIETQPGITGREKVADIVTEPARESLFRKPRSPRAENLNALVPFPANEALLGRTGSVARGWEKGHTSHNGYPAAVLLGKAFAQLREELAGGCRIWIERAIEERNV